MKTKVKTNETYGTNRNYSVIFISHNGIGYCVMMSAEDRKHPRKPILNLYVVGFCFLIFFLMINVLTMKKKKNTPVLRSDHEAIYAGHSKIMPVLPAWPALFHSSGLKRPSGTNSPPAEASTQGLKCKTNTIKSFAIKAIFPISDGKNLKILE